MRQGDVGVRQKRIIVHLERAFGLRDGVAVASRQKRHPRFDRVDRGGHFPTDDAATKLIWLALRNITADWHRPAHHWRAAVNQFAILYEERFTKVLM
jgi:putative transposase